MDTNVMVMDARTGMVPVVVMVIIMATAMLTDMVTVTTRIIP